MGKLFFFTSLAVLTTSASATTFDQYIDQVKKQNMSYQAADKSDEGAGLQKREADLLFTPQFFFNAQTGFNSQLPSPPFLTYDEVKQDTVSAGISQQFSFGLDAKLSYNLIRTHYKNISMAGTAGDPYYDAIPSLELSVPLWGNFLGSASKARRDLTFNQRVAEQYGAKAQAQGTLVDAEITYWRLAAAQENVQVQKKALDAAKNILSYVVEKKKKNLGEEADVLQARALTDAYELQLEQAQIEERTARRRFNLFLNKEANAPVEKLEKLDYKSLLSATVPEERPGDRPDVKASAAQVALARASSTIATEQNKPSLNLFGGYSLFGRGDERRQAVSQAGYDHRDSAYVGVRFQMPLNVSAQNDARQGAKYIEKAAELNHKFLAYSQDQEWIDLVQNFKDSQTTLKLAQAMELAQKTKLENERKRLRQGRTTTYQVLLFEQDFLSAEVSRIRAATQIIALKSQIQLYSSKD